MPSIITREYNPTNGAFVGNISTITFGCVPVGTHSAVKVIDFAFVGVGSVSNLRIGLLNSGGLNVSKGACEVPNSDGSCSDGYFGIQHSDVFDPQVAQNGCATHFRDAYTVEENPDNTVAIGLRDSQGLISQYVYLDVQLSNNDTGMGSGVYRIFFDYV